MRNLSGPLHLNPIHFQYLLETLGPSLGLWRAAEIAVLREQAFLPPVLDLGCGDGLVTSMVLSQVDIGLDPDPTGLERAGRLGLYRQFEAVPAEDSRLPDGCVNTLLSNSVLEHLADVDGALRTAGRLLSPGGRMIFTVPTDSFSRWLVVPSGRYRDWRNRHLLHQNLWSLERWAEHLHRAGLEIEAVRPYLRPSLVKAWDALELAQLVWVGRRRVAGVIWRNLPTTAMQGIARSYAALDLSANGQSGGRLIVARKR